MSSGMSIPRKSQLEFLPADAGSDRSDLKGGGNMAFVEDVIQGLERAATSRFRNASDMAAKLKVSQSVISKLFNRNANPRMDTIGTILDALGAKIVFPEEVRDRKKDCVFINAKRVASRRECRGYCEGCRAA